MSPDLAGYEKFILIKYDSLGNFISEKTIADTSFLTGIIYTDQDFFYASFYNLSNLSENGNISIIKCDTSGNIIWRKDYDGPLSQRDAPGSCKLDINGDLILAGSTDTTFGGTIIQKYDQAGNLIWQSGLTSGTFTISPVDLDLDSQGNIYIAGQSSSGSDVYYHTIMFDSSGIFKWKQDYFLPIDNLNSVNAIAYDNGYVFVTGRIFSNSKWFVNLLVYDTTGVLAYQDTVTGNYQNDNLNIGRDIVADGNGCVYLTGLIDTYERREQLVTLKYCSPTAGVLEQSGSNYNLVIYPNPNEGTFAISLYSETTGPVTIEVFDVLGNKISYDKSYIKAGNNVFDYRKEIELPGCYFLLVKSDSKILGKAMLVVGT
jgi:hypothetical protein